MYSKKPCKVEINKKQSMLFLIIKKMFFCTNPAQKKIKCKKKSS